ncbi:hypothetical protein C9426_09985 [Serratia sp. S1B]|nr:hypothetical protein C9426_09985 [Serratia sp. S1B]
MKKIYLLVFSELVGGAEVVKKWLNSEQKVLVWRTDIANCFYIVSEASANELTNSFIRANGKKGRYIITEITDNRQGLLTDESWYLLKNKRLKPK